MIRRPKRRALLMMVTWPEWIYSVEKHMYTVRFSISESYVYYSKKQKEQRSRPLQAVKWIPKPSSKRPGYNHFILTLYLCMPQHTLFFIPSKSSTALQFTSLPKHLLLHVTSDTQNAYCKISRSTVPTLPPSIEDLRFPEPESST